MHLSRPKHSHNLDGLGRQACSPTLILRLKKSSGCQCAHPFHHWLSRRRALKFSSRKIRGLITHEIGFETKWGYARCPIPPVEHTPLNLAHWCGYCPLQER